MKKTLLIAAIFPAMLLISGCQDVTTPKGIVEAAAAALNMGYYQQFYGLLGGNAKETYGNKQAADALKRRFEGQQASIGDEGLVNKGQCGVDCGFTVSEVPVYTVGQPTMTVIVSCSTKSTTDPKTGPIIKTTCAITDVR